MLLLLAAGMQRAPAQTERGIFHETATGMTMRYPVELTVLDAEKAMIAGHMAAFGSMQREAKEHALASRCVKPLLLAELPDGGDGGQQAARTTEATLLMFEFVASKECKAAFRYKGDEQVAGGLAQTALQLPGSVALSRPLWFDCGKEKLHAAFAAFGLDAGSPDQAGGLLAMTAMRYHNHIFGWLLEAEHLNTFNDLTKTSIELDDGKAYALVPFNLDDHLRLPIQMAQ